jgi:hypothetical protein
LPEVNLLIATEAGGAMLKMTISQNTPLVERADVGRLLSGKDLDVVR